MLLYVTLTLWTPYLIYFWSTVLSLCIAPFWFNPHQFVFSDFIIDYRYVFFCSFVLRIVFSSRFICILVNSYDGCLAVTHDHITTRGLDTAASRAR